MQNIKFKETENTPSIDFNFETGIFEIRGTSYPEYAKEFYEPILQSLREYALLPTAPETIMNFKFHYFNTGTNSLITGIFKELEKLEKQGHPLKVNWYHEDDDDDMRELGEYFGSLTYLPIEIINCETF
jgi:hypothetical protein